MKTVVFTGGGTGGHIYPGLAVVDELKEINKDLNFVWIGSNNGSDKNIVEKSGSVNKFYGIPCGKLRRYFSLQNFFDIFKIFAGVVSAFFILLKLKPAFLFSKGGFVSVPVCLSAKLLKIPVFTHECDFSPGLATRINKRFATKILVSYEATKKFFSSNAEEKVIVTGNPVRPVFFSADEKIGKDFLHLEDLSKEIQNLPVLLVIGGSLGSRQINELVWNNLEWLCKNFIVVHQCGNGDKDLAFEYKEKCGFSNYLVHPFIYNEMPHVMKSCHIVLSRAGANFLWECATCEKPMVLIPLSSAGSRGDQIENAEFFKNNNAAYVLAGDDANSENLIKFLTELKDSKTRENLSLGCKNLLGEKRSAMVIAELINKEIN